MPSGEMIRTPPGPVAKRLPWTSMVRPSPVCGTRGTLTEWPVVATQARIGSLVQGQDQAGTLPGWTDIASDVPGTLSAEERTANERELAGGASPAGAATCLTLTADHCGNEGGTYHGNGSSCANDICAPPPPVGVPNRVCSISARAVASPLTIVKTLI